MIENLSSVRQISVKIKHSVDQFRTFFNTLSPMGHILIYESKEFWKNRGFFQIFEHQNVKPASWNFVEIVFNIRRLLCENFSFLSLRFYQNFTYTQLFHRPKNDLLGLKGCVGLKVLIDKLNCNSFSNCTVLRLDCADNKTQRWWYLRKNLWARLEDMHVW